MCVLPGGRLFLLSGVFIAAQADPLQKAHPLLHLVYFFSQTEPVQRKKKPLTRKEPKVEDFATMEEYEDAWMRWRKARDDNNQSVRVLFSGALQLLFVPSLLPLLPLPFPFCTGQTVAREPAQEEAAPRGHLR